MVFQKTDRRSPPTLSRGVAPGLFEPSTIIISLRSNTYLRKFMLDFIKPL